MKSFFFFSTAFHGFLLAGLVMMGTLLTKPKMSYYAVDLLNSGSAGGSISAEPSTPVAPTRAAISIPVAKTRAPEPVVPQEVEASDQDTIRLLAKLKKKRMGLAKPTSAPQASATSAPAPAGAAGRAGSGESGTGSGLVADAGPAFPYPWYLKAIADRLDKQWRPPQEFETDTVCQVTFKIDRSGQVSGSNVTKSSGDSLFDQLAMRAVLYANPLPPLPNGFPDDILTVHMKFVGRRF